MSWKGQGLFIVQLVPQPILDAGFNSTAEVQIEAAAAPIQLDAAARNFGGPPRRAGVSNLAVDVFKDLPGKRVLEQVAEHLFVFVMKGALARLLPGAGGPAFARGVGAGPALSFVGFGSGRPRSAGPVFWRLLGLEALS
jgi:hypothetical protein